MVAFVRGGDDAYNLLAFGETNQQTLQYIENRYNRVSDNLTDAAKSLFATTKQLFHDVHGSDAMRKARAAIRMITGAFQENNIRPLVSITDTQSASLIMQRWIMACPEVRTPYHKQQCDGYAGAYVDMNPGQVGRDHYDYRLVMDGVVESTEEDPFKAVFYFNEILEGDRELRSDEKVDILSSWDIVRAAMRRGEEDPTSVLNDKL